MYHIFQWGFSYYRDHLLHTVIDVNQLWQILGLLICVKTNQDILLDSFHSFDLNKELNAKLEYESKQLSR